VCEITGIATAREVLAFINSTDFFCSSRGEFCRYCAPSSMKGVKMTITALLALLLKVLNSPALIAGLIAFLQKYLQL